MGIIGSVVVKYILLLHIAPTIVVVFPLPVGLLHYGEYHAYVGRRETHRSQMVTEKGVVPESKYCGRSHDIMTEELQLPGYTVYGTCPTEIVEKTLDNGTFAIRMYEARCRCNEGSKCFNGIASCKEIKKLIPVVIYNGNHYKYDVVTARVGCVCALKIAQKAAHKSIETLKYR